MIYFMYCIWNYIVMYVFQYLDCNMLFMSCDIYIYISIIYDLLFVITYVYIHNHLYIYCNIHIKIYSIRYVLYVNMCEMYVV